MIFPTPPENRIELTTIFGPLRFASMAECREYLSEPFWRKLFGNTKFHKRLNAEFKALH